MAGQARTVTVRDGLVGVNVTDAPLVDVLRDLGAQTSLTLVLPPAGAGQVTARWRGLSLEDALDQLLAGSPLTYRREGTTVVVADRQAPGMVTTRLLPLQHVPAGGLVERLPPSLRQYAAFELVQEQNALVVTGPADVVAATEAYVAAIDQPAEQLLLEVLVVEFETSGLRRLGVTFLGGLLPAGGGVAPVDAPAGWHTYLSARARTSVAGWTQWVTGSQRAAS